MYVQRFHSVSLWPSRPAMEGRYPSPPSKVSYVRVRTRLSMKASKRLYACIGATKQNIYQGERGQDIWVITLIRVILKSRSHPPPPARNDSANASICWQWNGIEHTAPRKRYSEGNMFYIPQKTSVYPFLVLTLWQLRMSIFCTPVLLRCLHQFLPGQSIRHQTYRQDRSRTKNKTPHPPIYFRRLISLPSTGATLPIWAVVY